MIGIDIVEIRRIQKMLDTYQEKFTKKIFTDYEINYCESFRNRAERYAARFALKEAVAKVIKTGPSFFWLDIEVRNEKSGAPYVQLSDRLKEIFPYQIEVSLSHGQDYAVGIAMAHHV
ncbi:MAG: holo-ACP synthase [Candidatus Margulisiibacteriota bacterium]|jgi:holo-[acyl-carrier protein] synthase